MPENYRGVLWNASCIPASLCVSCSPMSKINGNIWPRKSWQWSDIFLIHELQPLATVSNDEIASYTQFQKVSSSVASKSRRKTHFINLEGTGLKGTTKAMLSKHLATNAGWKLFGGHLCTSLINILLLVPKTSLRITLNGCQATQLWSTFIHLAH